MGENFIYKQDFYLTNQFRSPVNKILYFGSYNEILVIFMNGICQKFDLIRNKIIKERKIPEYARHLAISIKEMFFFSDPQTQSIFYCDFEDVNSTKLLAKVPFGDWMEKYLAKELLSLTNILKEQLTKEIYEESVLDFAKNSKNQELVLLFEAANRKTEGFINKITIYSSSEHFLIKKSIIPSKFCFLSRFCTVTQNKFVIICPLQQRREEGKTYFFLIDLEEKTEEQWKEILIETNFQSQILEIIGYTEEKQLILAIFHQEMFFLSINSELFEEKIEENSYEIKEKELFSETLPVFYFKSESGNPTNNQISHIIMAAIDYKRSGFICNILEIDFKSFEISKKQHFCIGFCMIAFNPLDIHDFVLYEQEENNNNNIEEFCEEEDCIYQTHFQIQRIGSNKKLLLLNLLEKKNIIQKFGSLIAFEIIDFLKYLVFLCCFSKN